MTAHNAGTKSTSWFRLFLGCCTLVLLGFWTWLASHSSMEPSLFGRYSAGYFAVLIAVGVLVLVSLLAQAPFLHHRLYKSRWDIFLLASATLVSLIAAEAAIRTFDSMGISYLFDHSSYQLDRVLDPVLGFKQSPGLHRVYSGTEVSINELGFRDRRLEARRDGELRILLLGDSMTFGWGVPIEATFGRGLETILAGKLGRPVRTVNTGVVGYNTVQEYASLRSHIDAIDPDLAVLLYIENDVETNYPPYDTNATRALHAETPTEVIANLLRRSWLYRLWTFVFSYAYSSGPTSLDTNDRGVKESMDALAGMATLCRRRGIPFVTFFYRTKKEPPARALFLDQLLSAVQAVGTSNGFLVVDVGPWWDGLDIRSFTNSKVDTHVNARGHQILAAGMADFLVTHWRAHAHGG